MLPPPFVPVTLQDDIVRLDAVEAQDVPTLVAAGGDPQLQRWVTAFTPPLDEVAMRQRVEEWRSSTTALSWAIRDAGTRDAHGGSGVVAGHLVLLHPDGDVVEVGYWLLPAGRGRGLATAALRLATQHAFTLGFSTVRLYHAVENEASCRVATRAGFTLAEQLTASWVYPDGTAHDEHLHLARP